MIHYNHTLLSTHSALLFTNTTQAKALKNILQLPYELKKYISFDCINEIVNAEFNTK